MVKEKLNLEEIFPEINLIQNQEYKEQVEGVWQEIWQMSEFTNVYDLPISPTIKYSHIPHNRAVVDMAINVANSYEKFHNVKVDKDVLIIAGLLQDVGKLVEYKPLEDGTVVFSELGEKYPHAFWSAHVALKHGVSDEICEILINHTPQSANFPKTIEGKILYYVDQLDVIAVYKDRWIKELVISK